MAAENYMTIEEATDFLNCSPETVRRAVSRGEDPAYRFTGIRTIRIAPTDLRKAMKPATRINEILGDAA
jgi:DNA binding domain, excisionase family